MRGAILGDIAGSRFEWHNCKSKRFELIDSKWSHFTDDSVMTIAIGSALMRWREEGGDLGGWAVREMRRIGRRYPSAGYGTYFRKWLMSDEEPKPYGSYGNGSAMRVSACGWFGNSIEEVESLAKAVTEVTHDHPEGIKGAQATAVCVYLARKKTPIPEIKAYVENHYYPIAFTLDEIRADYRFDGGCPGTVPYALEAFFESTGFVDAIRNAISIGGDSDTMAAITGAVAEAYWGIPMLVNDWVRMKLPDDLYEIVREFDGKRTYGDAVIGEDEIARIRNAKYLYEVDILPTRLINVLNNLGIETVADFLARPLDRFQRIRGFRPSSPRMRELEYFYTKLHSMLLNTPGCDGVPMDGNRL